MGVAALHQQKAAVTMEGVAEGVNGGGGSDTTGYPSAESDVERENKEERRSVASAPQYIAIEMETEGKEAVMAEGGEEKEVPESMKCVLCMEMFLDPASLPCGHTFCQVCLVKMRMSQRLQPVSLCPLCRKPWAAVPAVNIMFR